MVPEYVEQAGVYRNPETKKFMGTAEAESILEALNNQSALLKEIDENTEESPEAERKRSLNEEKTEKPGRFAGIGGKIGDGLKSVSGFLKDKNPLSRDRNPITRLLGFGALAGLLKLFGDKLTGEEGYLTKTLEWVKMTFIPWAQSIWEAIKDYDWAGKWQNVKDIFTSIKTFFTDMDKDGDGRISFDELKEGLKEGAQDLADGLVAEIKLGLGNFVKEYGLKIAAVWAGYKITKGLISALLFGGAPKVGMFAGLRFLGLAGITIGGLVTLHNDIEEAYKDVLDRDGKVTAKTLLSRFLAGENNPEGKSWTDAILGSWKAGLQGAAVGLTAGLVTGGVFSIPLAAIGFITGATASALGVHLGEDKLNQNMEDMETNVKSLGDDLKTTGNRVFNFFKGIIDAADAIINKETTVGAAFDLATKGNVEQTVNEAEAKIQQLHIGRHSQVMVRNQILAKNPNQNVDSLDATIASYDDAIAEQELKKAEAQQTATNAYMQSGADLITSLNKDIAGQSKTLNDYLVSGFDPEGMEVGKANAILKSSIFRRDAAVKELSNFNFVPTQQISEYNAPTAVADIGMNFMTKTLDLITAQDTRNKLDAIMKNNYGERTGPAILNAPTNVNNSTQNHLKYPMLSVPAHHTAIQLSASWTNYYGYPNNHR